MVSFVKKYPKYKWVLAIFDFLVLNLAALISINICRFLLPSAVAGNFNFLDYVVLFSLYSVLVLFYFQYANLYKVQYVTNSSIHFFTLLKSCLFIVLGFILFQFSIKNFQISSRFFYAIFFVALSGLTVLIRIPFVQLIEHNFLINDRVVIIGAGVKGRRLYDILNRIKFKKVVGFIDDTAIDSGIPGVPVLGKVEDVLFIEDRQNVDFFILAIDNISRDRFFEIFRFFQENKLPLSVSSKYLKIIKEKIDIDIYDQFGMVRFNSHSDNKLLSGSKRFIDITLSLIAIVILFPVLLGIALAVKFSSKGPVIYKNIRIGKHGQPFYFYKFRSMFVNSDRDSSRQQSVEQFIKGSMGDTASTKIVNKSKITRVGHVLRKYSLDELPQLFNVVIGDMSLVGPRPCLRNEWSVYEDWQKLRLDAIPGCTGIWQVSGRSLVNFEETVLMDIYYNQNSTPWLDLQILLKTIPVMLLGKGGE